MTTQYKMCFVSTEGRTMLNQDKSTQVNRERGFLRHNGREGGFRRQNSYPPDVSGQISMIREDIIQIKQRLFQSRANCDCRCKKRTNQRTRQRKSIPKMKLKKAKRKIRKQVKRSLCDEKKDRNEEKMEILQCRANLDIGNAVDTIYEKYMATRRIKARKAMLEKGMMHGTFDNVITMEPLNDILKKNAIKDVLSFRTPLIQQKLDILPSGTSTRNPFESLEQYFSSQINDTVPQSPVPKPMNIEMLRLESFRQYPLAAKARPIRLARSGFFYTGREDRVECYSCGIIHRNWSQDDDPDEVHRRISPECRHILHQDGTNVPIHSEIATENNAAQLQVSSIRQNERESQNALQTTPSIQTNNTAYAVANTVHISAADVNGTTTTEIRNVAVNGNLVNSCSSLNNSSSTHDYNNQRSSPMQGELRANEVSVSLARESDREPLNASALIGPGPRVHANGSATISSEPTTSPPRTQLQAPITSFSTTNTLESRHQNPSVSTSSPSTVTRSSETPRTSRTQTEISSRQAMIQRLDPLGISFDRPRYPSYAILNARISSFQNWPPRMTQTPREMARAGFFYAGHEDFARCFFCGGGLRNWEAGDDPWVEHARWFPRCAFLRQNKGEEFVALVQEQHRNGQANGGSPSNTSSQPGTKISNEDSKPLSPAVQSVKEMGYSLSDISEALETVKSRKKKSEIKAEDILEVLIERQGGDTVGEIRTEAATSNDTNDDTNNNENTTSGACGQKQSLGSFNLEETQSLIEENRRLKEQKLCKICLDQDACIAMLPCGHLCCCAECALAMRKCPICRQFVKGTVKTWLV